MSIFLIVAGMFALPVLFAGGLFVVANFGPFFGIDLKLENSEQGTAAGQQPETAAAAESRPQEPSRPARRAA